MHATAPARSPLPPPQPRPWLNVMLWIFCGFGATEVVSGAAMLIVHGPRANEFFLMLLGDALLFFCVPGLLLLAVALRLIYRLRVQQGLSALPQGAW
jgi:hypothetical protein